eukprot:6176293-Pleurochrysis_carterae.AAC.1
MMPGKRHTSKNYGHLHAQCQEFVDALISQYASRNALCHSALTFGSACMCSDTFTLYALDQKPIASGHRWFCAGQTYTAFVQLTVCCIVTSNKCY